MTISDLNWINRCARTFKYKNNTPNTAIHLAGSNHCLDALLKKWWKCTHHIRVTVVWVVNESDVKTTESVIKQSIIYFRQVPSKGRFNVASKRIFLIINCDCCSFVCFLLLYIHNSRGMPGHLSNFRHNPFTGILSRKYASITSPLTVTARDIQLLWLILCFF